MKMLRKIIDGKNLEISQENVYEGVSFSKVTNLQHSDGNLSVEALKVIIYSQVNVFGGDSFSRKMQV